MLQKSTKTLFKKVIFSTLFFLGLTTIFVESFKNGDTSSVESNFIVDTIIGGDDEATIEGGFTGDIKFYDTDFMVGQTYPFGTNFNGSPTDKRLVFKDFDSSIIDIDLSKNAMIVKKEGTTKLVVTSFADGSKLFDQNIVTKSSSFEYVPTTIESIKNIELVSSIYKYGEIRKLDYKLYDQNNKQIDITNVNDFVTNLTFESSDKSIMDIDEYGYVLSYKKGTCDITISSKINPTISATTKMKITPLNNEDYSKISYLIRKLIGHFSLFLFTAFFGCLSLYEFTKNKGLMFYISSSLLMVLGVGVALLSELSQTLPGGRSASLKDVLIDSSGFLAGILLVIIIVLIIKIVNKKKPKYLEI
jgi:VanZ family protein